MPYNQINFNDLVTWFNITIIFRSFLPFSNPFPWQLTFSKIKNNSDGDMWAYVLWGTWGTDIKVLWFI